MLFNELGEVYLTTEGDERKQKIKERENTATEKGFDLVSFPEPIDAVKAFNSSKGTSHSENVEMFQI